MSSTNREDEIQLESYTKKMLANRIYLNPFFTWAKTEKGPPPRLNNLPPEVFEKLGEYLGPKDIVRLSRTSRQHYINTDKKSLLPHLSQKEKGQKILLELRKKDPNVEWIMHLKESTKQQILVRILIITMCGAN
jgi:hypothetical protein